MIVIIDVISTVTIDVITNVIINLIIDMIFNVITIRKSYNYDRIYKHDQVTKLKWTDLSLAEQLVLENCIEQSMAKFNGRDVATLLGEFLFYLFYFCSSFYTYLYYNSLILYVLYTYFMLLISSVFIGMFSVLFLYLIFDLFVNGLIVLR